MPFTIEEQRDDSDRSVTYTVKAHGRRCSRRVSFYQIYGPDGPGHPIHEAVRACAELLRRDCAENNRPILGAVVDDLAPGYVKVTYQSQEDGTYKQRLVHARGPAPETRPATRPRIATRKIIS